jgi:hypothetical protein
MAGAADFIQKAVHTLETGKIAMWVKCALAILAIAALGVYNLYYFRGLATAQAMDQAQIGRNIASLRGWKTNLIRPRAVGQLAVNHKNPQNMVYDSYEAPLPPLVDAVALHAVKARWKMTSQDLIYIGDKAIAAEAIMLFLASILVLYALARRLFDHRLALIACGLVLLCDLFWEYSLSGLPQMLMLLIFNSTLYAVVRALEAEKANGRAEGWLAATGAGFGLLALSHALTLWILAGAFIFLAIHFRRRVWLPGIVVAAVAVLYLPWLLRNFVLTGNLGGVAIYSIFDGVGHSEAGHMRRLGSDLGAGLFVAFRTKMIANFSQEIGALVNNFGWNMPALMFFPALLHRFKRPETSSVRWMVLAMWLGAMLGMSVYGVTAEHGLAANELNLLFVPIMICFGMAYLLVLWNRLDFKFPFARAAFVTGLYLICALPMIFSLPAFSSARGIRYPPYLPPYISILNQWMKPNEIIASDMPWAVAWYADRRSLWLPDTVAQFNEFHDFGTLGGPVNGIYLTPVSGTENKMGDIIKGDYREWARFILHNTDLKNFPLRWVAGLGIEDECVFYGDRDRH